ncbi:Rhodanese-like protein [Hypoxylon sp. NC1633]|nr:Rhodanese-like protein [Hypoxylon sp. NC1633]
MATRRLAMTAALRVSSRATSTGPVAAPGTPRVLRVAFGTAFRGPRATRTSAAETPAAAAAIARPRILRHTPGAFPASASVRWSSDSAGEGKIWNFEDINAALSRTTKPGTAPAAKITLIDVREPSELASTGRIPGALNIPISSAPDSFHVSAAEFEERFGFERPRPDADGGELVLYCKAGVRSRAAAAIARDAGFARVGEYPGSWLDWVEKGGKVER